MEGEEMISLALAYALQVSQPPPGYAAAALIEKPVWIRLPTGNDLARLYPPVARDNDRQGQARVACYVKAEGYLERCQVIDESPSGAGFGEATIRAATLFRMKDRKPNGSSVEGGIVIVPIRWTRP